MKIARVRVRTVEVPDEDLIAGRAERQAKIRPIVTLRIQTSEGVEGIGIAFVHGGLVRALGAVLEELSELTLGEDPARIEAIRAKLERHASTIAGGGLYLTALSAIDCALWDIMGKVAGLPLWKLLGGVRREVPTYASGPLHRDVSPGEVAGAAQRIVDKGFTHVKMNLALPGNPSPLHELERARLVREVVGPHVNLMCDINERWRVEQAIDVGRRLEEVGLFCIEDPTKGDDYPGLARITAALSTPVMAGENSWGTKPFQLMLEARSVDIVMIDLMHAGGIGPWMKIAAMAETFNVPVVSHIMPEFQAQLVGAVPNGLLAEYKAWTWRLFDGYPEFASGCFVLSDRPGHGMTFSREFTDRT